MFKNPFDQKEQPLMELPEEFWLDLNTATEDELSEIARLGLDRARLLVEHRPFRAWKEVQEVPGFSAVLIEKIQRAGVLIRAEEN